MTATVKKITFATVRETLATKGVTIRPNEFNEYRVAMKGDHGDGVLIDRGHTRESQLFALEECLSEGFALANYTEKQAAAPAKRVLQLRPQTLAPAAEKVKYRLGSNPMVYAPGIIGWAISGYWNKPDRANLEKVVSETWKLPIEAASKLLSKAAAYTIENEAVVFEA